MLGLDREPSDAGMRGAAARGWRLDEARAARPAMGGGGGVALPEIPLNAGRARYVAGDAALAAGPYSRRPNDDFSDLDSFAISRLRPAGDPPLLRAPAPVKVAAGGGGGGGGVRRTDWSAKYGGR